MVGDHLQGGKVGETLDFESGVTGLGSKKVTVVGAHGTFSITSQDQDIVQSTATGHGSRIDGVSMANETGFGLSNETLFTVTIDGSNTFDLSSIKMQNWDGDPETIVLTSAKGSMTFTGVGESTETLDVAGNGSASFFQGISSFTITENTPSENANGFKLVFDDMVVTNITAAVLNAAPTIVGAPSDITVTEDTASSVDLSGVTFADSDDDNLTVTLTVSAGTLAASAGGNVTVNGSNTGTLTLSGSAANINTYLDTTTTIKYTGASSASGDNAATLTISAEDGNGGSLADNVTVNLDITDVNDGPLTTLDNSAPVLDDSKAPALVTVLKNLGAPQAGSTEGSTLVSDIINTTGIGNYSDADGDAPGLAITGVNENGTLYYTTNGGQTWVELTGTVSDASALLLAANADTRLYFKPDADYSGTLNDALTIKAWDGTAHNSGDTVNSTNKVITGSGSAAQDVEIAGNYAYIAASQAGLQVIDLTTRQVVGSYDTPGFAQEVKLVGKLAYVADGNSGLQIIDIADPTQPKSISTFGNVSALGIDVVGSYAYIAASRNGLVVIDISNTSNPTLAATFVTGSNAKSVEVSGDYAYVLTNSLEVVNISNLQNLSSVGTYSPPQGTATNMAVAGNFAYIASSKDLLQVDITDPEKPTLVSSKSFNYPLTSVTVDGDLAYITFDGFSGGTRNAGLLLVDISNPNSLKVLQEDYPTDSQPSSVAVVDGDIFMTEIQVSATTTNGLKIIQQGANTTAFSSSSDSVSVTINNAPVGSVTIAGSAEQGEILTVSNGLADTDGLGTISYQWLRDGEVINGATDTTYTLTQADVGSKISVRASYTDLQGTKEVIASSPISVKSEPAPAPTPEPVPTPPPIQVTPPEPQPNTPSGRPSVKETITNTGNTPGSTKLVENSGNANEVTATLPGGVSLVNQGARTATNPQQALADLIGSIDAKQPGNLTDQTGVASQWLASRPGSTLLDIRTLVLDDSGSASTSTPILITGIADDTVSDHQEAFVIDASALPSGNRIQLDNIDFASIIGATTLSGGAGANVVSADDAAQTIVLGAGDDELHAGGGRDLVGSHGGDDLIYGDAGHDRLFGGEGDDTLDGGSGVDIARFALDAGEATFRYADDGSLIVNAGSLGSDTLKGIELLRFDDRVMLAKAPALIEPSDFDEAFYLAANPDIAAAVAAGDIPSGEWHYQHYGADEGRLGDPAALNFDRALYLAANPDVAAAVAAGDIDAFAHYRDYGTAEGRSPNALFDERGYREANADVDAAIQRGELDSGYQHYQAWGWQEGRDPSAWFDQSEYLEANPDIAEARVEPLGHYLRNGYDEGRVIVPADDGLWG